MPRDVHSHAHRVAAYPAHAPKRHADHGTERSEGRSSSPSRSSSLRRRGSAHRNGTSNGNGSGGNGEHYDLTSDPETSGEASSSPSHKKPLRSATQMAGEDLYIRLNDREDFWSELEALLELPEGCDLVMLDNTIRMFVTICGAYHGKSCEDGRATSPCSHMAAVV